MSRRSPPGGAILVEIGVVIGLEAGGELSTPAEITSSFGSPGEIGRLFLSDYLLAFEVTSFVLLVGALGGVVLGSARPPPTTPRRDGEVAASARVRR